MHTVETNIIVVSSGTARAPGTRPAGARDRPVTLSVLGFSDAFRVRRTRIVVNAAGRVARALRVLERCC